MSRFKFSIRSLILLCLLVALMMPQAPFLNYAVRQIWTEIKPAPTSGHALASTRPGTALLATKVPPSSCTEIFLKPVKVRFGTLVLTKWVNVRRPDGLVFPRRP